MKTFLALLIAFMTASETNSYAQSALPNTSVKVTGAVTKPLTLSVEDLSAMKQVNVSLKEHDGAVRQYRGVPVMEILQAAGATVGKELRGKNLGKYLLVTCADGYQVVFSLAELDSSFTNRQAALVWGLNGKPLAAEQGPFKLIVPGEKKPARSCRQVTALSVGIAKE